MQSTHVPELLRRVHTRLSSELTLGVPKPFQPKLEPASCWVGMGGEHKGCYKQRQALLLGLMLGNIQGRILMTAYGCAHPVHHKLGFAAVRLRGSCNARRRLLLLLVLLHLRWVALGVWVGWVGVRCRKALADAHSFCDPYREL